MRKERLAAIDKVRGNLIQAERDLDAAVAAGALLSHAFVTARAEANLAIAIGQEGFNEIAEANRYLAMARACYARGHMALREAPAMMGLPEVSFGDGQDCPRGINQGLRAVG